MAEWIFGREQGCCAWLGRGPGKRSERRSRHKAICPNGMRSFQNELHHFIILNLKWYKYSSTKTCQQA